MRKILDTISIVIIAALVIVSINLYITLLDERAADKMLLDKLVCDDVEIEFKVGEHYRYLGGCRFENRENRDQEKQTE